MTTDLPASNATLGPRREIGTPSIASVVAEGTGLTRTRHFGSTSTARNGIQASPYVHVRRVGIGHSAVWTSGEYRLYTPPTTPLLLADRGDQSKWVMQVTSAGAATFKGGITAGSIDIPNATTANSFHVNTSGTMWSGTTVALFNSDPANAPFTVSNTGSMTATTATIRPKTGSDIALLVDGGSGTSNVLVAMAADEFSDYGMWMPTLGSDLSLFVNNTFQIKRKISDTGSYTKLDLTALWMGGTTGGSTFDTILSRPGGGIFEIYNETNSTGATLQFRPQTAPATPGTSNYLRLYDEAGVLKWKSSAGTVYDLSQVGGGPISITLGSDTNAITVTEFSSQTANVIQILDSSSVEVFRAGGTATAADVRVSKYAAIPVYSGRRAEGTSTSPTAIAADSVGAQFDLRGYTGSAFATGGRAQVNLVAAELWTTTANGTYIQFKTTPKTTTTATEVARITDQGATWLKEIAAPSTPSSGFGALYFDSTSSAPHALTDGGTNFDLSTSTATPQDTGTAAPGTATNPHSPDNHVHGLEVHGASKHTDITRSLFITRPLFTLDSGTAATLGTVPSAIDAVALADAALQGFYFDFAVPHDWASGAINAVIYWVPGSTDGTAHTVRWRFNALEVAAGADITAAATATSFTGSSAARTANLLVVESSQAVLTPSAADTIIKLNIRRVGADANDTYVGTVNVIGVRLDYTATG